MTTNVSVQTAKHDDAFVKAVTQNVEQQFDAAGVRRTTIQLTTERKVVLQNHLVVIVMFLIFMAVLTAAVGGMALASSMSISVMERTREIGILRAIGASTGSVLRIIVVEGLIIGMLSWLVAIAFAWPLSVVVGNFAGQIFIATNLDHVFPPYAMAGWLGLIFFISVVASVFPAWGATRLTIREVIAYE